MLFENIGAALAGIKANKLRSFLTMLGIMIGIAAIIAITMAGNGVSQYISNQMNSIGANKMEFYVSQKNWDNNVDTKSSDLISQDMIRDVCDRYKDRIKDVSLTANLGDGVVKDGKSYANVTVQGANSASFFWEDGDILAGREILPSEQQDGSNVALVSDKFVDNLFNGNPDAAVGKEVDVLVNNQYYTFTIVGVYKSYDSQQMTSSAYDMSTTLYVPLKVVHRVVSNATELSYFDLNGKDGIDSIQLSQEIADYLNDTYYAKNENFYIEKITMQEQAQMLNQEIGMIKLVMGGIGAISLLVSGIGVMNIMIVSITERTREIGTRKALGATNGSIRLQFITEAIVLCVIGGLLGLGFGMLLGHVITNAIGYPGTVTVQNVVAVLLFSTAFGIFFGYYPANRAAKMNPIDALRYE